MKRTIYFLGTILILFCLSFSVGFGATKSNETILDRVKSKIQERSQIRLEEFEKNRAELKELMNQKRIELQKEIEQKKEELKQKRVEFQAQLKEQLQKIRQEKKRKIVENIYERVNQLNERITNHYLNVLNQLEERLERIESRTAKAKLNHIDTTQVEQKINEAHSAIERAREAVKNQTGKVYAPPEITSEENLRSDVGKLRNELHNDLKNVEQLVREARDKVREAAVALAQINNVDQLEIPSTPVPTIPAE